MGFFCDLSMTKNCNEDSLRRYHFNAIDTPRRLKKYEIPWCLVFLWTISSIRSPCNSWFSPKENVLDKHHVVYWVLRPAFLVTFPTLNIP